MLNTVSDNSTKGYVILESKTANTIALYKLWREEALLESKGGNHDTEFSTAGHGNTNVDNVTHVWIVWESI
jgi:hypothetical protein